MTVLSVRDLEVTYTTQAGPIPAVRGVSLDIDTGDVLGTHTIPGTVWRGLYQPDAKYQQGDLVRWGGSVWIAKMDGDSLTPGTKGLSESLWDLYSERGRTGKTGDRGAKGEQGPRGERGERGPDRY